ncbi:MAG: hypothetical protein IJ224_10660 [Lachnospiraceae bacterium]|nr:hypothetical protein [Lachnospiraceae bacterium]
MKLKKFIATVLCGVLILSGSGIAYPAKAKELNETNKVKEDNSLKQVGEELDAPTNVRWEGGVAKWDAVDGANYYTLKLFKDGELWGEYPSLTYTEYNLENDITKYAGTYSFSITARKDKDNYYTGISAEVYSSNNRVVSSEEAKYEMLPDPTNVRWDGMVEKWDAVEGAGCYFVSLSRDGVHVWQWFTEDTEADWSGYINGSGTYIAGVTALKDMNSFYREGPFSNCVSTDEYVYGEPNDVEKYNIILDSCLSSFWYFEQGSNAIRFVETASPGDRIEIRYDQDINSIPKGKYIKDIKYTGVDNTDEGFQFDEGGIFGASIAFDMPENDVSFEAVLGDTEDYIIDLSKDNITISPAVWNCLYYSTYNSEDYSWNDEEDSNNVYWDVLDIGSDGTWDIKISGQENYYKSFKVIKNPDTNLNSLIRLTPDDDYRPNYYVCLDFEDKEEGTLDNTTIPSDNYAGATLSNTVEELKTNVLTAEDKEALEAGEDIKVWLDVDDITSTVSKTDKDKIEANKPKGFEVGSYLDISLFKKIGTNAETPVTNTSGKIKIQISVPANLQKTGRDYKIARLHNGTTTILSVTKNGYDLTFETDQFSTYALLYSDPVEDKKTDDKTDTKTDTTVKTVNMYRLYNPNSGEHFYTANEKEKNNLVSVGWRYEGIGWKAPVKSNTPVYRLYNKNAGDHHYTMSEKEKDNLVKLGWKYEGIGWYSDDAKSVPLYRQYNPNAKAGSHNYTTSKSENDMLVGVGWKGEGVGWYGVK